jgi:hypothetical protein
MSPAKTNSGCSFLSDTIPESRRQIPYDMQIPDTRYQIDVTNICERSRRRGQRHVASRSNSDRSFLSDTTQIPDTGYQIPVQIHSITGFFALPLMMTMEATSAQESKTKKKKTKTKKNLAAFRIRISRLAFTFFNVFFLFNMFRFARTTSTMSDVVDEAVLDSQDSIALIADAMEIVLRCGALYGDRPAASSSAMPKVSVLLPRFADLWRGGTASNAYEFIDGEMNLVEFVLFCLVCAVGRPTGGFTSVDDASQQQHSGDAFYDAFRCSRDVRRTCDMVSRKPLPPVRFNVVGSGDRHSTYPHVHTIFSARGIGSISISSSSSSSISNNSATSLARARSKDNNNQVATATVRSEVDHNNSNEIADVRAIAAAVFRAAKAHLTTVERGGNRARGGCAEFYEACFHKYLRGVRLRFASRLEC